MTNLKAKVVIDLNGNVPEQARRYQKNIETFANSGSARLAIMGRNVATVSNQIDRLGNRALLGVGGAALLFNRTFVKTAAEFERFNTILETVEGSSAKAKESMKWVTEFAATTPYELAQVTDAFVRLRAYGMDPIQGGLLRTLGDTASAMGKPLEAAVEAIADAVTGENERLKEFGIKAAVHGKKIVYTYTANGKTMRKSALANSREQIAATLQAIWNDRYAGAMDKMSKTWTGLTSNLSDQWTLFQNQVMEAGAFDYLKGEINDLLGTIEKLQNKGSMDQKAKAFSDDLIRGLKAAKESGKGLWTVLKAVGSAVDFVAQKAGGYEQLAKILASIYLANKALRVGAGVAKVGGGIAQAAGALLGGKGAAGKVAGAISAANATPVFVTNWPGGMPGVGVDLPGKGKLPSSDKIIKPSTWRLLKNLTPAQIATLGGGAMATGGALVGAAGIAGYGVGTLISKGIEGTDFADRLGATIAMALAKMGNKTAQEAIDADLNYRAQQSTVQIELVGDGARFAKVTKRDDNVDVISSGAVMGTR